MPKPWKTINTYVVFLATGIITTSHKKDIPLPRNHKYKNHGNYYRTHYCFHPISFLYGILCLIIKKWPVLIWIVGIGGGVILAIITSWWIGAIGGFILIGFLAAAEASGGHKCAHCGSYDTDVTKKEDGFEYWQCNKCHGITYDYITK